MSLGIAELWSMRFDGPAATDPRALRESQAGADDQLTEPPRRSCATRRCTSGQSRWKNALNETTPARVLFLCTGNSTRSQIAEALAEQLSGGKVSAASAGSDPKPLHPISEFAAQRFDYVISLCDRVRDVCPEFPGGPELIHWSIPDPAREPGNDRRPCPRSSAPLPNFALASASSSRQSNRPPPLRR
jgi:protein-tyrosine-phosphatase